MGRLIAIDGLDGSGKGTQSALIVKALSEKKVPVKSISFPDYDSESSVPVRLYLGGALGGKPEDTNGYAASSFFAIDRYISWRTGWGADYADGGVIIANRYTSANAIHQLTKLERSQWDSFLDWLCDFEYKKLGIPSPDLVLFFELLPEYSMELVRRRCEETGAKLDIHEMDPEFIYKSYEAAKYAAEKLNWKTVRCFDESGIRTIEDVFAEAFGAVSDLLAL